MNDQQSETFGTMKAVVAQLREKGYSASIEYPGWISVGGLCFGDENPTWCWNDPTGEFSGESRILTESTDAAAITAWIVSTLVTNSEARIARAIENANAALWKSVVETFPEAKSGDLSPLTHYALSEALKDAIEEWVRYNVPTQLCSNCGNRLDDSCGKSLGCEDCDAELCCADCAEAHEEIYSHGASKPKTGDADAAGPANPA